MNGSGNSFALITNIAIGTCILSACLFTFVFGPTYPALQAPLLMPLSPQVYALCIPSAASDDILWTQVLSEESLADQV